MKVARFSALHTDRFPPPQVRSLVVISFTGCVNASATVRPEIKDNLKGLKQLRNRGTAQRSQLFQFAVSRSPLVLFL
jgi:hypothetical protein